MTPWGGEFYVEADSVQPGDESSKKSSWRRRTGGILLRGERGQA